MKHRLLIPVAIAGCLAGCREPAPPAEVAPESVAAVEAPPAPEGLRRAVEPAFGMAVPAGVTLERRDHGVRHYRISAEWDDLERFFARELGEDYVRTAFSRGARFEATDGSGRAVYLHRERSADAWVLTYFDTAAVAPEAAGGEVATPATGDSPVVAAAGDVAAGAASSAAAAGAAAQPPPARGTTPTPEGLAQAQQEWRQTYRNRLQEEFGAPVESGSSAPEPTFRSLSGPRVHPRLRGLVSEGQGGRQPLNFVRGVREDRRNPDAEF